MKELLERLRGATEGTIQLDRSLHSLTGDPHPAKEDLPAYSRNLDAALALVERALPSHNCIDLSKEPPNNSGYAGGWEATISRNYVNEGHWAAVGHAPTAPLALLIALLGALGAVSEASAQTTDEDRKMNNNPSLSKPNQ